jgi:hypothetical protein
MLRTRNPTIRKFIPSQNLTLPVYTRRLKTSIIIRRLVVDSLVNLSPTNEWLHSSTNQLLTGFE